MSRMLLPASVCMSILSSAAGATGEPPDVLMIVVDDLRPMLGCYGVPQIRTPHIDRLAERGVLFERAYCQYAKCGTSRLSMLTGLRPDSVGVFSNNVKDVIRFRERRPDVVSLPRWLKQNGYHTQAFGKIYHDGWDVAQDWTAPSFPGRDKEMLEIVDDDHPEADTVIAERFDCPVLQSPDVPDNRLFAGRMTERVLAVMTRLADRRRFLAVGFRRPHLPFVAPQKYYDLYRPDESWLAAHSRPAEKSPIMAWFNSDGYVGGARRVGLTMPVQPDRRQAIAWNGYEMRSYNGVPNHGPISVETQLQLLQAYAACVTYVDTQIGRLLDGLSATGRRDQTIVILCSDHGWHLGEHSAWGKMTNFEIATRVPMIVSAPGIPAGRTTALAELVDLYPTVCELTGIRQPDHIQGESLVNVLQNPQAARADETARSQYARFRDRYMGYAVRTDRYRFVRWVETASGNVVSRELYDHSNDRGELFNLADEAQYAPVVTRLENQLR